jgi:hypothetical protein
MPVSASLVTRTRYIRLLLLLISFKKIFVKIIDDLLDCNGSGDLHTLKKSKQINHQQPRIVVKNIITRSNMGWTVSTNHMNEGSDASVEHLDTDYVNEILYNLIRKIVKKEKPVMALAMRESDHSSIYNSSLIGHKTISDNLISSSNHRKTRKGYQTYILSQPNAERL